MSRQQILRDGALVVAAVLMTTACSDLGGSATLGPSSLGSGAPIGAAAAGAGPQYADVMTQGGGGVYAANGATLVRQPGGLRAGITMPTPRPGNYNYPAGKTEGAPEVFTLWIFVFNHPELCTDASCGMDDLGNTPAKGGAYNGGGHVVSGNSMTISGRIGVGETPFAAWPLELPATAEVHLAIAPHGDLNPGTLPDEFRLPTGPSSFWWVAIFN